MLDLEARSATGLALGWSVQAPKGLDPARQGIGFQARRADRAIAMNVTLISMTQLRTSYFPVVRTTT